ncbi:hypothetical protein GCM10010168_49050 [Actinoplanes ianthinogenes]|uniref:Uncharacterized protein n=1 Tax=Actinoplanes ianthinogenes TaxID=122358 RepID=A0ABN6CLL4_9ACTN|nr:hypothetical protein [Actinoplanes ianthinogenes]BCJ45957.1 hypothetical protein Aiant_66140 [Actinoplanes ianthinogenes]GGR25382.1 hypothetical protein GCM10010168_49050 [Actinoplanes ianthinogenes]
MPDVFKILRDLEMKAVGVDPQTQAMQEGYFVAFRNVGLPIRTEDYEKPWSPIGVNLNKPVAEKPPADPANADTTASEQADTDAELQGISRAQRNYINTFLLTDRKLRMSNTYQVMPGSSRLSDTWWAIMTGANGIPPKTDLKPEIKAAYDKARAFLMDADDNPTPKYQKYLDYRDKYRTAVKAYNRAYSAALTDPKKLGRFPNEGKLFQDDVDSAFDEWQGFGAKSEVEKALATLAAQGTDPAIALIARCKRRWENSLLNFPSIGNIPWTVMSPESWYDATDDSGWNDYSSTDFHTESHYKSSSTSIKASGGLNLGLWSVGGHFGSDKSQTSLNVQTDNLDIRFKYSVVDVSRVGIDTSLLFLKNWFLFGDYQKNAISKGTMAQELPQAGQEVFLPSIVTSLIVVKDFEIGWKNWKQDWQTQSSAISAGASVGYACFAIGGSYEHRSQQSDFVADDTGERLKSPGIQVIGYVSEILPASPAHDSSEFMQ